MSLNPFLYCGDALEYTRDNSRGEKLSEQNTRESVMHNDTAIPIDLPDETYKVRNTLTDKTYPCEY